MKKIAFFIFCVCAILTTSCKKTLSNEEGGQTVTINFSDKGVEVTNPCKGSVEVEVSKFDVTISSPLKNMTYHVSGNSSNGQLKIYSDYKLTLILDNLNLSNQRASVINIQTGKKTTVELRGSSSLSDATVYTDTVASEDEKACLFSEGQLVFTGSGKLSVTGRNRHAICSDDYIRVENGTIVATSSRKDAIHVKDYFECNGGTLQLTTTESGTNGIDVAKGYIQISGGDITVNTLSKGIVAAYKSTSTDSIVPNITIDGGTVKVTTSGEAAHAIRTANNFTMNGGNLTIVTNGAQSNGINATGAIVLNSGKIDVTSTADCTNVTPIDHASVLQCH